jgi:hypothetical protein
MPFSVPLILEKSVAVVHRLNPAATKDLQPYSGATGYDKDFKEPRTYDRASGQQVYRENARIELPAMRIPCQVESARFERLNQLPPGDVPDSSITLVFHRRDLKRLKLIDPKTLKTLLRKNDRVSTIESYRKANVTTVEIDPPGLYFWEIAPGSFGFGSDGFDLFIVFLSSRERAQ